LGCQNKPGGNAQRKSGQKNDYYLQLKASILSKNLNISMSDRQYIKRTGKRPVSLEVNEMKD